MATKARAVEGPTLGLILACYAIWGAAGLFLWPVFPILALIVMMITATLHGSLVHEACHGHPTRIAWVNEALVSASLGMIWPYRRFKTLHLRHHANEMLTDPFEDPESYYREAFTFSQLPSAVKFILALNNTMLGRIILGPLLGALGLIVGDIKKILTGDRAVIWAWWLHLLFTAPLMLIVIFGFGIPFWAYALIVIWGSHGIISVRTFAEHRWHETSQGRSIIVEKTWLGMLFLNNNLHLVHHESPSVPWYKLPTLYRAKRAHWVVLNDGYVFKNYTQLFTAHALRAKEPVVHPVWTLEGKQK